MWGSGGAKQISVMVMPIIWAGNTCVEYPKNCVICFRKSRQLSGQTI
jgi:hypothetical protein